MSTATVMRSMPSAAPVRLRAVEWDGCSSPPRVTARELAERAVLVRWCGGALPPILDAVGTLLPWLSVWRDHALWRGGYWTCVVGATDAPYSTGERAERLALHTDMSRYRRPPAINVIRCVRPDPAPRPGGGSLLLHVDDLAARLEALRRDDVLAMLRRVRRLNVDPGPPIDVAMLPAAGRDGIARIYDPGAASHGQHLALGPGEHAMLQDVIHPWSWCGRIVADVPLAAGDLLAFSNHHFLHGRGECHGRGRITEVVLGNVDGHVPASGDWPARARRAPLSERRR